MIFNIVKSYTFNTKLYIIRCQIINNIMETTRTPLRSIHPTKPIRRPRLKPGWRHHVLYYLHYFETRPDVINPQESWATTFPWSIYVNRDNS